MKTQKGHDINPMLPYSAVNKRQDIAKSGTLAMHAVRDIQQGATKVVAEITGFCAGTSLLTMDGELPVEHLSAGDRIITRDCGMAVLKDVKVSEAVVAPVIVKPGSLGHTGPDRTTTVLATTRLMIRDWRAPAMFGTKDALVEAERLIDGEFIAQATPRKMRIYTLVFDAPHILYADGLEVSTA